MFRIAHKGTEHANEAFIGNSGVFCCYICSFSAKIRQDGRNKLHMLHQQACQCRVKHGTEHGMHIYEDMQMLCQHGEIGLGFHVRDALPKT
jgi:hypothetical protein